MGEKAPCAFKRVPFSAHDPKLFRQYAAECRRLADHASEKDRAVLLEIADAWLSCAGPEERKKGAVEED
jgi:hypothetical protein